MSFHLSRDSNEAKRGGRDRVVWEREVECKGPEARPLLCPGEWSGRQCESSGGSKGTEQELTSERKWGQDHEAFSHARTLDFNHAIESYWKLWASE